MREKDNDKDFLKTLYRGISVIKSFDSETPQMTLSDVARKNNMSRASARRFILTLQSLGYLTKSDDTFKLTAKVLEIGHQYLVNLNFIEVITPIMREVSRKLYKACSASILNDSDIVYVARIPSQHQILSVNLNIGSRLPAYCTSMGRVLLGNLSEKELDSFLVNKPFSSLTRYTITDPVKLKEVILKSKKEGYCIVNQELEANLCSVAVPVRNRAGIILCSINIGIPISGSDLGKIKSKYLPTLKAGAEEAEKILVHFP